MHVDGPQTVTLRSKDPFHLQQMEDLEKRYKRIAAEVEEVAELIFCCLLSYMNCRIRLFDLYSYVTDLFLPCLYPDSLLVRGSQNFAYDAAFVTFCDRRHAEFARRLKYSDGVSAAVCEISEP